MQSLHSDLHLFQNTMFKCSDGRWEKSFLDTVKSYNHKLTIDLGAVLSILSFGYVCGNRTLCKEIKRKPWLSGFDCNGEIVLQSIPPHKRFWKNPEEIAEKFEELLIDEADFASRGSGNVCILLSGGLDSRVIAGVFSKLYKQGRLKCKPLGITWGLENSRDVVYGSRVAEMLNFDWQHIDISSQTLIDNIDPNIEILGCLNSPNHLHCMQWFRKLPNDTLVVAGSYGDSIGRAEFMGKHLLELDYLSPINSFGILREDVLGVASQSLKYDFDTLINRAKGAPKYVQCEHQMQGHYMRGMIGHVMSIISHYCELYQMFTTPEVYRFIWSLHPSCRTDHVYAELLKRLNKDLARLPWARTNRALEGRTRGRVPGLMSDFHRYSDWVCGPVYEEFSSSVDFDWFDSTGIFDTKVIRQLNRKIKTNDISLKLYGLRPYEIWLWLVSFRRFAQILEFETDKLVFENASYDITADVNSISDSDNISVLARIISKSKFIKNRYRKARRCLLFKKSLKTYPPEYN